MQPERQPHNTTPEPSPEEAELLEELARVEHEIAALGEYREQLQARLEDGRAARRIGQPAEWRGSR